MEMYVEGSTDSKKTGHCKICYLYIINLKILKLKKIKSGVPEPPFYTFTVPVPVWMWHVTFVNL